jgi:3-hydroxymyristoyl/3-hydroxydecanoyl-(acyl carrier protein) dehydratase
MPLTTTSQPAPEVLDELNKLDGSPLISYYVYVNATSTLQVLRIANVPDWYFERVVFPGQQLFIEAKPEAVLEVYSGTMVTAVLEDRIVCESLEIVWL